MDGVSRLRPFRVGKPIMTAVISFSSTRTTLSENALSLPMRRSPRKRSVKQLCDVLDYEVLLQMADAQMLAAQTLRVASTIMGTSR